MNRPTDLNQRLLARDPSRSFVVSAPAGSGKTGLLTQRVLRLLTTVDHPEEVLCITFTRKAAGEMATRIQQALENAHRNPRPDNDYEAETWDLASQVLQHDQQQGWNLLQTPGRLRIQTIDGFCRYIARQFALETTLGELPEPTENPQSYYQKAAESLLSELDSREEKNTVQQLTILLAYFGNDLRRLSEMLADMLGNREQWLPLIFDASGNQHYFNQVIRTIIDENLQQLATKLSPIAGELASLADFAAMHLPDNSDSPITKLAGITILPGAIHNELDLWSAILDLLTTKSGEIRKQVNKNQGFPTEAKEQKARIKELFEWCHQQPGLLEALTNVLKLPEAELENEQQAILDALSFLLPQLVAHLNLLFQQDGTCDYPAITLAALQALSTDTDTNEQEISDITLRLDYQLRHILIDEFQDTSAAQFQLLKSLVSGWQSEDGRTLFLVGDAMQSLYGFRNANVGLFIDAQQRPIGPVSCEPLSLTTNFRSQSGIIDWVNNAFDCAFPSEINTSRGAIPYALSHAFKEKLDRQPVSFLGFFGDNYRQAEAEHIASTCQQIRTQYPDESIAILVRNRGHLTEIIPALRSCGLTWQATDIDPLASCMPVIDVLSLTRALLSPADRIAWLAILRAPWCGLNLNDLFLLSNFLNDTRQKRTPVIAKLIALEQVSGLSEEGLKRLKRVAPLLVTAWEQRNRTSLRSSVEQLWGYLGGPKTLQSDNDLHNVRRYFDLLEEWESAGTLSDWQGFNHAVDKLYADNSVTDPEIQIMTIHKSKGLEFDHVLIPGLGRKPRGQDNVLLRWQERLNAQAKTDLIMAVPGAYDENENSLYRYLKYEDQQKSRLENTRVLYVAATRAVKQLYLFAELKQKKEEWQTPVANSLLAPVWPFISADLQSNGDFSQVVQLPEIETPFDVPQLTHIRRLPSIFPAKTLSRHIAASPSCGETHPEELTLLQSRQSRLAGTLLHRTLKQIAVDGIEQWNREKIEQLPILWRAQFREQGIMPQAPQLEALQESVKAMLADKTGRWILHSHPQAQCELALNYWQENSTRPSKAVIDRTFVSEGTRWIIDYKNAFPHEGQSTEQFVKEQSEHYGEQLKLYRSLFNAMESKPVQCALYFPQIALFAEVDVD